MTQPATIPAQPPPAPTLIDLYAGCGGVTLGFKHKGFRVLGAVEIDPMAAATYRHNHPEVILYEQDIRQVDPAEMMTRCGLTAGSLTVLSVCAPCQPFSRQTRGTRDEAEARLVLEMVRFMAVLRPRFAIMENVPDLAKGANLAILDELLAGLRALGYHAHEPETLDAVDYGVPQFRRRLILLCSRTEPAPSIPPPTHADPRTAEQTGRSPWRTVRDAFRGVHRLGAGRTSRTDPLHKARAHAPLTLERLRHTPLNGGSRRAWPEHLHLACHRARDGYNDVYGRMDFARPANTLTTGCTNLTKGRFAHPTANRAITPREAARLQTFPDTYHIAGNYDDISTQIGNAVPVELVAVFAAMFHRMWEAEQGACVPE